MKSSTEIENLLKKIQETFGYSLLELSQKIGVTEAAVSRWNNGRATPSRKNLLKIKQLSQDIGRQKVVADRYLEDLVVNKPMLPDRPPGGPPDFDALFTRFAEKIKDQLEGRFEQLTKQVALLQGDTREINTRIGRLDERVAEVEKKIRRRDPKHHIRDRTSEAEATRKPGI